MLLHSLTAGAAAAWFDDDGGAVKRVSVLEEDPAD